jgi:hypothetical protein
LCATQSIERRRELRSARRIEAKIDLAIARIAHFDQFTGSQLESPSIAKT